MPSEEMWVGLDYTDNFGVSACLPDPTAFGISHKQGLITGVLFGLLIWTLFGHKGAKGRKSKK
jgi:hypothetical protein